MARIRTAKSGRLARSSAVVLSALRRAPGKWVKPEIETGAVRVVGSSLLAAERVAWLTAFRVLRGRRVLYLGAAPGLVPPVPLNLTEENEELRCCCGLLLEQRAIVRKTSSIPPNTRNDTNKAKLGNDFGFTFRMKARSGTPPSSGWRYLACLAGNCRLQDHRSLIGDTPDTRRTHAGASP